jgi:hypothetical protein
MLLEIEIRRISDVQFSLDPVPVYGVKGWRSKRGPRWGKTPGLAVTAFVPLDTVHRYTG